MKILGKNLNEFRDVGSLYLEIEGCLDNLVNNLQRFAVDQHIFSRRASADYHFDHHAVMGEAYLNVLGKINRLFNTQYEDQKEALHQYFKTPAKSKELLLKPGPMEIAYRGSKIKIQGKDKSEFEDVEDLARSFAQCLDTLVFELQEYIFENHDLQGVPTSKDTETIGGTYSEAISRVNIFFNTKYLSVTHCLLQYFRDPCRKSE